MLEEKTEDKTNDIDDPYRRLAFSIVCRNDLPTVHRYLTDYKFVRRVVIRETKEIDLSGPFLDCLAVELGREATRGEMLRQLGILGGYFYRKLDLARLRSNIRQVCEELGIADLIEE